MLKRVNVISDMRRSVQIPPSARKFSLQGGKTKRNNCFSIYHTSWIASGPKSNFICDNIQTKAILFFVGCSEVISKVLFTSEQSKKNKMAFVAIFSQIKLIFGPLLIQLVSYKQKQLFTSVSVKVVDIYLHFDE